MKKITYIIAILVCFWSKSEVSAQNRGDIRLMFYNTENFFDTQKDSINNDGDYTPEGKYHWTPEKYKHKLTNIYKVIAGVGGWQPPEIIGFSEIENRHVLEDLLYKTPLLKFKYEIVHFDSPDIRGIDVALLFRSDKARLLSGKPINIQFPGEPQRKTRNILLAKLLISDLDTLNIFVNHWPSRRGGEIESEKYRIFVASILRSSIDSIITSNPKSKIVIMGDFNDDADNVSILETLRAEKPSRRFTNEHLYNLTSTSDLSLKKGTYCFMGNWQTLDQFIVSGSLLTAMHGIISKPDSYHVFNPEFLLQTDERYAVMKPLPTYAGLKYLGGFSDHLPVYLDLFIKN